MKAAFITKTGTPDVIQIGDVPLPQPGPREVLVRVKAVAVNPIDTYIRGGAIKAELPKPYIIGCDLAGVVEQCGPEISLLNVGDRVWCSNQGLFGRQGTFAEYAAVDEKWLYNIPAGQSELNVNLADPLAILGGVLFILYYALYERRWPQWRISRFNTHIIIISLVLTLALLIGYRQIGWTSWAVANRYSGWFILLGFGASAASLVHRAGRDGRAGGRRPGTRLAAPARLAGDRPARGADNSRAA